MTLCPRQRAAPLGRAGGGTGTAVSGQSPSPNPSLGPVPKQRPSPSLEPMHRNQVAGIAGDGTRLTSELPRQTDEPYSLH